MRQSYAGLASPLLNERQETPRKRIRHLVRTFRWRIPRKPPWMVHGFLQRVGAKGGHAPAVGLTANQMSRPTWSVRGASVGQDAWLRVSPEIVFPDRHLAPRDERNRSRRALSMIPLACELSARASEPCPLAWTSTRRDLGRASAAAYRGAARSEMPIE